MLPLFLILYLKRINGTFGTHGTDGTHGALVPAAVLDGLPVEGPRDLGLGVAPHVADEAHVALQDLFMVVHGGRFNKQVGGKSPSTGWSNRLLQVKLYT